MSAALNSTQTTNGNNNEQKNRVEIAPSPIPDRPVSLPVNFTLAQYRFSLEALDDLHFPPIKTSALRGGFGHVFKKMVCQQPQRCQEYCERGNLCPYGYIFETAPPDESQVLRNFSEVPRPFIISSPADHRALIPAGEHFSFDLTLIGYGINFLPYFIVVFRELGRQGLGQMRGRYRLAKIEAVRPWGGAGETILDAADELVVGVDLSFSTDRISDRITEFSANHISLRFLTPTRLKHDQHWVMSGPAFAILINKLLGRISSLSYFHCGEKFEADFRGLIERAKNVKIVSNETSWQDWSRYSGRQKQRVDMGGLVGQVTYEGELRDYLHILALGELVHVGKGTVFGNGQYQILP